MGESEVFYQVDILVAAHAGTRRDKLADDDVFLQAQQRIHLAFDGGVGKDAGGLLEGGGGKEALGGKAGLGDTQQHALGDGGMAALEDGLVVGFLKAVDIHQGAGQQRGIAAVLYANLAQHLLDDDLDVLVGDVHALLPVHAQDLAQEVVLHGLDAQDAQQVVGVDGALDKLLPGFDVLAVLHFEAAAVVDLVDLGFLVFAGVVRVGHGDLALFLVFAQADHAADFAEDGVALGLAGLKELLDAGKTLGDVVAAGNAAGVEGAHGQLRAGLADGLSRNDAHGLAHVHGAAGG